MVKNVKVSYKLSGICVVNLFQQNLSDFCSALEVLESLHDKRIRLPEVTEATGVRFRQDWKNTTTETDFSTCSTLLKTERVF